MASGVQIGVPLPEAIGVIKVTQSIATAIFIKASKTDETPFDI